MRRAVTQVAWNYKQFRRRVKRYVVLAPKNTRCDLEAVARSIFPRADQKTITLMMAYVSVSKRDLSALGDIEAEVRDLIDAGKPEEVKLDQVDITKEQVDGIINQLMLGDKLFAQRLAEASKTTPPKTREGAEEPNGIVIESDNADASRRPADTEEHEDPSLDPFSRSRAGSAPTEDRLEIIAD
jgi:hypothetical protein